jgi:hypothetical protein
MNDIQRYSKEACGNSFGLSPKYFLYKSSAGCPSISRRIFASDFVIIRSGPKESIRQNWQKTPKFHHKTNQMTSPSLDSFIRRHCFFKGIITKHSSSN